MQYRDRTVETEHSQRWGYYTLPTNMRAGPTPEHTVFRLPLPSCQLYAY